MLSHCRRAPFCARTAHKAVCETRIMASKRDRRYRASYNSSSLPSIYEYQSKLRHCRARHTQTIGAAHTGRYQPSQVWCRIGQHRLLVDYTVRRGVHFSGIDFRTILAKDLRCRNGLNSYEEYRVSTRCCVVHLKGVIGCLRSK